jgi:ribosomal protein L19E
MAMSDKELKKIKEMMPSGASLQGLKNIIQGQRERAKTKKNKSDRHPGTGSKAGIKSITSKLKSMYPVGDKDIAFLKKSMKKSKQAKPKRKKTGPGSR